MEKSLYKSYNPLFRFTYLSPDNGLIHIFLRNLILDFFRKVIQLFQIVLEVKSQLINNLMDTKLV